MKTYKQVQFCDLASCSDVNFTQKSKNMFISTNFVCNNKIGHESQAS